MKRSTALVTDPACIAEAAGRVGTLDDDGPGGEFLSWNGTTVPW